MRYELVGKCPLAVRLAGVLLLINTLATFTVWALVKSGRCSSSVPSGDRPHEIVWRGGVRSYVARPVGAYFDLAIPLQFAILAIIFLLFLVYRKQVRRVAQPPAAAGQVGFAALAAEPPAVRRRSSHSLVRPLPY